MLEYSNIKIFLRKVMFQVRPKKILLLKKLKISFRGQMLLVILKAKKRLEHFTKKITKKKTKRI